MRIQTENSWEI